jgi:ketosteroid isomerase-like protein
MSDISTLPVILQRYFEAFAKRDLSTTATLFSPEVQLQDPSAGLVRGRENVLKIYSGIFEAFPKIDVDLKRAYCRGADSHAVEFDLELVTPDGKLVKLAGIDCIEHDGARIHSIRAYLDTSAA